MSAAAKTSGEKKVVRELKHLKVASQGQAASMNYCHRCHRCHRCHYNGPANR